jgi:hypothetical protein
VSIKNRTLRTDLQPGDTISNAAGSTRFILKTAEPQGDGVYKGLFWFWAEIWKVKILCEYWDLSVNTDNVILKVGYESVSNPQFLLDVDAAKNFVDSLADAIAEVITKDTLKLDTPIENIYVNDNGDVVIVNINPDGSITETTLQSDDDINSTVVQDKDGNVYVVNPDGTVAKAENMREDSNENEGKKVEEDDRPISSADRDFLYITVAGRPDTLMDGHTLTLTEQSGIVKLRVGYKDIQLYNSAHQTIDAAYQGNIKVGNNRYDSVRIDNVKWKLSSTTATGVEFQFVPKSGTIKLEIDASNALPVILWDESIRKDTLIAGNRIKKNKITVTIHTAKSGILRFKPKDNEYYKDYGFDDALITGFQNTNSTTKDYDKIQISGTDYYVPWLGVLPDTEVEIKLDYTTSNPELDSLIVLEGNSAHIQFPTNENKPFLEIFNPSLFQNIKLKAKEAATYIINAYSYQKGITGKILIGQLKIESQGSTTQKKIRIIRIKRSDENDYASFTDTQKSELMENINKYYKQAFIKFELDTDTYQDTLTISKSSNEAITDLSEDIYKKLPGDVQTTAWYYLFICSQGKNTESGKGKLPGHYSVLFNPSGATPSHELGHNLGLQHTFENDRDNEENVCKVGDRKLEKLTTKNIMDYDYAGEDNRHLFFKYQIDYLKVKKNK